jgi:hypothetical protein
MIFRLNAILLLGAVFVSGCSGSVTSPSVVPEPAPVASTTISMPNDEAMSTTTTMDTDPANYVSVTANQAFGFNASRISGFPGGRAAELTGGGAYNLDRIAEDHSFVNSGGGFRCLSDISGGPFAGCLAGQGFQCTGSDPVKTAFTGNRTVVQLADFYRQGNGNVESFTAKMIVSDSDLDPVADGVQNVWLQGVGCATGAVTNFN